MQKGACHCGAVRFEVTSQIEEFRPKFFDLAGHFKTHRSAMACPFLHGDPLFVC